MRIKKQYFHPLSIAIFLSSLLLGLYLSTFGQPYVFHPDEIFILKRPFKKLIEYSQFDFSNTFSLYDILLMVWYGLYYLVGLAFDFWGNFSDFKQKIILEKFEIIYGGRVLSCLFVASGNLIYYFFLTKWYDRKISIALLLVFNPLLIPSVFWVKYDALMYLVFSLLYSFSFQYWLLKDSRYRQWVYLIGFVALSVRIEAILFIILFAVFDIARLKKENSPFFSTELLKSLVVGFLIWSFTTMYPLHILSKLWGGNEAGLLISKTYEGEITKSILSNIYNMEQLLSTVFYYLKVAFFLLGPIVVVFIIASLKDKKSYLYLLYTLCFMGILVLNGYESVHYLLPISPIILALALWGSKDFNPKWKSFLLFTMIVFILSITLPFLALNKLGEDPRIAAKEFILKNTTCLDTLAIETISMNGFHPAIDEFPGVLKRKSKRVSELTGMKSIGYLAKASAIKDSSDCRYILDIFKYNYLNADETKSNEFINTYDSTEFFSLRPNYLISTMGEPVHLIGNHYTRIKKFAPYCFNDKRCDLLYSNVPEVSIFKRLK